MPSVWDHKADKDLLLTIIEDGNLTHINWTTVSAKLQTKQYTFSQEACRQHYQKIRKESRSNSAGNGGTTPTKPNAAAKSTPASKRKNGKAVNNSSNDDDEEELESTPTAKRKRSVKEEKPEPQDMGGFAGQTAAQFKEEFADGENGQSYGGDIDLLDDSLYVV